MSEEQTTKARRPSRFDSQLCVRLTDGQRRKLEKIRRINKFDNIAQALRFVLTELH